MSWVRRLVGGFLGSVGGSGSRGKVAGAPRGRRVVVEPLEDRRLLSVGGPYDFGDIPDNYGTTLAADGARHEAVGPTLGALRDAETDGLPTVDATGDDANGSADEDGVTFGEIRVGQLDASVTVNVQNAPSGAKLDAWIDFNGDGSFGGAGERIAHSVEVTEGDNVIEFDVPSWAILGETYARFRVSSAGDLGSTGVAGDGEVEDYRVTLSTTQIVDFITTEHAIPFVGVRDAVAADVNADGHMDIVTTNWNGGVVWYENDGSEEFTAHAMGADVNEPVGPIVAADVNGDGHLDLVSAKHDRLLWYENNGDEQFTEHSVSTWLPNFGPHDCVHVADINGDGHMDLLSASKDASIAWYENDGNESFTEHTFGMNHNSVFAADVDRDGDLDVLFSSWRFGFGWYENNGSGDFVEHTIDSSDPGAYGLFGTDLDGDDDLDAVATRWDGSEGTVTWYENDGSESFTPHVIMVTSSPASSVFAADVDGDGDTDVLSAGQTTWHENIGDATFRNHVIDASTLCVHVADIDGDADLDLLTRSSDGKITWQENLGNTLDFGDAPDSYGTTLAADGARHGEVGPTLGAYRDIEDDGQPTEQANGDDYTGLTDEYGVRVGLVMAGQTEAIAMVNVQNAPSGAKLDAWIDFDGNGVFDPGDRIADSLDVVEGENVIRFDVPDSAVAGQSYARFRLSSAGDLEPTGAAADGEVEDHLVSIYSAAEPVDLGELDFYEVPLFYPSTEGKVYEFTTKYAGYLTVLAKQVGAPGYLTVQLLDESGTIVGDTTTNADDTRIERFGVAASKKYFLQVSGTVLDARLKIVNLVEQVDDAVTVHGTDAGELFYYQAGDMHGVTVHGLQYDLDPAAVSSIHFACGAGDDYVSMIGSSGAETAVLQPYSGSMTTTATGFTVSAEDVLSISARGGGGNDMVEVIDGEGDDLFTFLPTGLQVRSQTGDSEALTVTVGEFGTIHAYAKNGGTDRATLQGTDGAERVKVYPEIVKMMNTGNFARTKFFEKVEVDAKEGKDTTIVTGSAGSDVVWASASMTRVAYDVELSDGERPNLNFGEYGVSVVGSERVVTRARGGDDWVELHDSALNDVLIAKPNKVEMMNAPRDDVARGAEYRITARGTGMCRPSRIKAATRMRPNSTTRPRMVWMSGRPGMWMGRRGRA